MKKTDKKTIWIIILLILPSFFGVLSNIDLTWITHSPPEPKTNELTFLRVDIGRLMNGSSSYVQFKNETGVYETIEGEIEPVFSFPPRFDVGESNTTHIWIIDPTNRTDGYYIERGSGYQELLSSRGQTNRHFYNETDNTFTFQSDLLVNETNLIDGTDWVDGDEYPSRFVIRLTNGTTRTFEVVAQISNFISLIDNSTIWGVGYESFWGVMGFYLNFQDVTWGHGQYLYWPRLQNGQLTSYNQPLYAIYPHIYAKVGVTWYDQILNDRSLYAQPNQNPRNTLNFYNTSDTFGLYFFTPDVVIQGFNWNFVHGFKYNFTDQLYHIITRFECTDRSFDDIGMGYEINSSPQSDGTPYQPDKFVLSNETHEFVVTMEEAWQAGTYLEDYYSQIRIVSQNNESFKFTFDDMENAGFTEKYLELHNQLMPGGDSRDVLLAGMYGYGSYSANTVIKIDPSVGPIYTSDNYDLYYSGAAWSAASDHVYVGKRYLVSTQYTYTGYLSWDTTIETAIDDVTAVDCQVYVSAEEVEASEGFTAMVYDVDGTGDGDSSHVAKEDSQSWTEGTSDTTAGQVLTNPPTGDYQQLDTSYMEDILDFWASNRGDGENWLNIRFIQSGCDNGETGDHIRFYDAQYGSNKPKISITYTVPNETPTAAYISGMPSATYAGKPFMSIITQHTDADGITDIDTCQLLLGLTGVWYGATYDPNTNALGETGSYQGWGENNDVDEDPITDGCELTWNITLDFDFDYDDVEYDLYVRTYDDQAAQGYTGWLEAGTTYHESDLEVISTGLTWTYPTAYEYGGSSGTLEDSDWYKDDNAQTLTIAGDVEYEGSSQTFDSKYSSAVSVQWFWDQDGDGSLDDMGDSYDDDDIDAGAFSISFAMPAPTGVDVDGDADMDLAVQGIPTGGADVTGAGIALDLSRDNEPPTMASITVSGSESNPVSDWDQDGQSVSVEFAAVSDGSGSGFGAYRVEVGDSTPDLYSTTDDPYTYPDDVGSDGSYTIYARPRDNVWNQGTVRSDIIYVDETDPVLGTTEFQDEGYDAGTTCWYDQGEDSEATFRIPFTETNVYSIAVVCTLDAADRASDWSSGGSPFDSTITISGRTDTNGQAITITITDKSGRTDSTFSGDTTIALDDTAPTSSTDTAYFTEVEYGAYLFWDSDDTTFWYGDEMGVNEAEFTVGVDATDGGIGLSFAMAGSNLGGTDEERKDTTEDTNAGRTYDVPVVDITSADSWTGTLYLYVYDLLGNYDATPVSTLAIDRDTAGPVYSITWNFNDNDWCVMSGSDFRMADIDINSLQDADSGLDYVILSHYNGTHWPQGGARYVDTITDGDNTEKQYLDEYCFPTTNCESTGTYSADQYSNNIYLFHFRSDDMVGNMASQNRYIRLDRTAPSGHTIAMASGWFYSDKTNDSTPLITCSDASDSGSGLAAAPYDFCWRNGSGSWTYSGFQAGATWTPTIDQSYNDVDFAVRVKDEVGNTDVYAYDYSNWVDFTAPSIDVLTPSESTDYLYYPGSGTSIWYGSGMGSAVTFTFSGTTSDNFGLEVINSTTQFGESPSDSSPATYSLQYTIESSDNGDKTVKIVLYDQCGNIDIASLYTFYEDNTSPSSSFSDLSEDSVYLYWNTTHLFISDDMGSTAQSFTVTVTSSDGGANPSDLYAVQFFSSSWGDNSPVNDTAAPYSQEFLVSDNEDSVTMDIKAVDHVGNWESTIEIVIIDEGSGPNVALGVGIDMILELSDFLYTPDNTTFWYGDGMGSAQTMYLMLIHTYNGSVGISHINTSVAWWSDTPSTTIEEALGIITNPSFEDPLTEWTGTASRMYSPSAHTGSYCIQATPGQYIEQDITDFIAGGFGNLTFWSTAYTTHDLQIVFFYTDGTNTTVNRNGNSSAGEYAKIFVSSSLVDSAKNLDKVRIRNSDSTYTYQWDDVYFNATRLDFDISSSDSQTGTLVVKIWTNTGQQANDTITVSRDTTDPTTTFSTLVEDPSSDYQYISGQTYYFSDLMGSTDIFFTITVTTDDGAGAGVRFVNMSAWDDDVAWNDSASPWTRTYSTDSTETSNTITLNAIDHVGNVDATPVTITCTEDTTNPTCTITRIYEGAGDDFLYNISDDYFWYGDDMPSSGEETSTLAVDVTTSDGGSGEYALEYPAYWQEAAWNDTGGSPHTYTYEILPTDTDIGTFTVTCYDNVGNTATDYFLVYRDTTEPDTEFLSLTESAIYLYYSGSGQTLYICDDMYSNIQYFTLNINAIDTGFDNYDFEDGTLSPWVDSGIGTYLWQVYEYSGQYSFYIIDGGWVQQDIDNITVSSVNEISCYVWTSGYSNNWGFRVYYTDESYTDHTIGQTSAYAWVKRSLTLGELSAGKTIDKIRIRNPGGGGDYSIAVDYCILDTDATSGVCGVEFLDSAWGDNSPQNDTASPYSRQFEVTLNEDNATLVITSYDNVGNWDTYTINITIIDEGFGSDAGLTVGVDSIVESTDYVWCPDNATLWYGDDMVSAQTISLDLVYTYSGSVGISHCNLTVTWFSDNPSDSSSPYDLELDITSSDTQTGTMTIVIWTNMFQNSTDTVSVSRDITDPTMTFALFQDTFAYVSNYYHTANCYTNVTGYSDEDSGLPTNFLAYREYGESWGSWISTIDYTWTPSDQSNTTLFCKITDQVHNEYTLDDWVIIDTVAPVLGWLTLNESWAPNWYDQAVSTHAHAHILWVDNYAYHVNVTCSLTSSGDDLSPSGGASDFDFTLTGQSDGSYSVSVIIYDKAGWNDSTLAGSEAPIQLEYGMTSKTIENWYYFYYFRQDGLGLDWRDFNTTYVLDENYKNYTEVRLRGGLYAQKYLNSTSSIRIICRDYFGSTVLNTSYTMPTSFDFYIELSVNRFKIVNLYDEIMNMTIEHITAQTIYTEQVMPYEVFWWDLYATVYNVTVYVHNTAIVAHDEDWNNLLDYQINMTLYDVAIFIDARDPTVLPIWGQVVANGSTLEYGSSYILAWYVVDLVDWEIWINGTLDSTGTSSFPQLTFDTTDYTIATYNLTLQVTSPLLATNTSYIQLVIDDTVFPDITYNTGPSNGSTIEWGTTYTLAWNFSESIDYELYVNGSMGYSGSSVTTYTYTFLTLGLWNAYWYNVTLKITDGGGNVRLSKIYVYNLDTTSPSITIGYSSKIVEYSATGEHKITWTVYDLHNYNASTFIDGVSVANYTLDTSTEFIEVDIVMDIDTKLYKITVYDSAGNYASDTVTIQVTTATNPGGGEEAKEETAPMLPDWIIPLGIVSLGAIALIGVGAFIIVFLRRTGRI